MNKSLLIGGSALKELGSPRYTQDKDYLVYEEGSDLFYQDAAGNDYCNAAKHPFFAEIYKAEKGNKSGIASIQSLFELKIFAFTEHCFLFAMKKVANDEHDIAYLVREYGCEDFPIAKKHVHPGAIEEVNKIISEAKKERK